MTQDPDLAPAGTVTHIAGVLIRWHMADGTIRARQRCAWCGAVIDDVDLSSLHVAAQPGETEPAPYPSWPGGAFVSTFGNATWVETVEDPANPPATACVRLDPDVTR